MKKQTTTSMGPTENDVPIPLGGKAAPGPAARVRALEVGQSFTAARSARSVMLNATKRETAYSSDLTWTDGKPSGNAPKAFEIRNAGEKEIRVWRTK